LTNIKTQNGLHLINIYKRGKKIEEDIEEDRRRSRRPEGKIGELFGRRFGEFKKKQYLCAAQKNIINK
jgi:hypothetical protein